MIAGQRVARPWLGIAGVALSPLMAEQFKLNVDQGILVREAVPGGPPTRRASRAARSTIRPAAMSSARSTDARSCAWPTWSPRSIRARWARAWRHDRAGRREQTVQVTLGEYPEGR